MIPRVTAGVFSSFAAIPADGRTARQRMRGFPVPAPGREAARAARETGVSAGVARVGTVRAFTRRVRAVTGSDGVRAARCLDLPGKGQSKALCWSGAGRDSTQQVGPSPRSPQLGLHLFSGVSCGRAVRTFPLAWVPRP